MFRRLVYWSLAVAIALLAPGLALAGSEAAPAAVPDTAAGSMLFIENAGQWAAAARFQAWGSPLGVGTTWLTEDAIWISVVDGGDPSPDAFERGMPSGVEVPVSEKARGVNLKLSFVGANPHPQLEPADAVATTVSYFLGNDPAQWRPAVPVWHRVRYVGLYPGVDLEVTDGGDTIVQRLLAHPGADTTPIKVQIEGAAVTGIEGRIVHLDTTMGQLALPLPVADFTLTVTAETAAGPTSTWTVAPASETGTDASGQAAAPTDDPADLLYATFVGGNLGEVGAAVVMDGAGHAYVSGLTSSNNFPTTPGAFDPGFNGGSSDAFVFKLTPAGSSLRYATFLGGSYDDYASGIRVDGTGVAYVMGSTNSSNFPTTLGAFDAGYNGSTDVFVVKLSQAGNRLIYATYVGGTGGDNGEGIAIDGQGNAYAVGWTGSGDFPTTPGTFDPSLDGPNDAFVVKLNSTGSNPMYSTFLGGNYFDIGWDIAVNSAGIAFVTGTTLSSDFPFTPGAFDPSYNGIDDAFVVKLNPVGSQLVYATFLGTRLDDSGLAIVLDGTGSTYVIGRTFSSNFPTTPGAYDRTHNGSSDTFVLKLNPAGSSLTYSTFLGGGDEDIGEAIIVDTTGQAFVTGLTRSNNFPTTPGAYDTSHNGSSDVFIARLNANGSQLIYGTFVGSPGEDPGKGIAVDGTGKACVTGETTAREFPSTPLSFDPTHNGGTDVFVLKLDTTPYTPHVVAPIEQPAAGTIVSGTVTLSGFAIDLGSSSGTGVDAVHIYLDGPQGSGTLIGAATYGLNRPDVAAQYGTRFGPSGWERTWDTTGVVPGIHWLYLYAHRTTANAWTTMPAQPVVVAGGHAVWLPLAPTHE